MLSLPKHLYRFVANGIDYCCGKDASTALSMTSFLNESPIPFFPYSMRFPDTPPFRWLLLLLLLTSLGRLAGAQSVDFSKDNFGDNKDGLREAIRELKAGDDEYYADPPRYAQALPHLLAAQHLNPNNAALNVKIGDCYLHSATKTAALPYLQKAAKLDATADPRTHYLLGPRPAPERPVARGHRRIPAGHARSRGTTANGEAGTVTATELQRRLQECRNGQQLMAHPVRVFIDNAGPELNSAGSDYGPVVAADESTILITSRRAGSTGGKKDPNGDTLFRRHLPGQPGAARAGARPKTWVRP